MAVQKDIFSRLKRLFSRQVLVKRIGRDKLKTIDLGRSQVDHLQNDMFDKFKKMYSSLDRHGSYNQMNNNIDKLVLYEDYEMMDNDPIISSALDILSDESTLKGPQGHMLKISTENDRIKSVLENLFGDILNLEHNLWSWVRNLCKYGDYYLYLDLEERIGIKNVIPMSPYILRRLEGFDSANPHAYKFVTDDANTFSWLQTGTQNSKSLESYQVAHFRLLSDTNFLPYGKSVIENGRKIFKQLSLMEDAMLLVRIMRAPERRIFKIDVGNIPATDVDKFMRDVKDTMQKTPYIDQDTGDYNLRYNLQNMIEDFYVPVRGGNSGTTIDTLPGLASNTQIEDIQYLKTKLLSALKIPPAFLGYDSDLGGRATLAALDIRFARTIERIQKVIASELKKIAIIHLYLQGFKGNDLTNFELSLATPSIVYERQKVEFMSEQMDLVEKMLNSKIFSNRYTYEKVFGLSETEWKEIQDEIVEDQKYSWRIDQITSTGEDPEIIKPADTPVEDDMEDIGDDESTDSPSSKPLSSNSKLNAGYDEDGRQEMNRVTKPEKNPLGPEFYGKGTLEPEHAMITGKLSKLFNTDIKKDVIQENKIVSFLDERRLDENVL